MKPLDFCMMQDTYRHKPIEQRIESFLAALAEAIPRLQASSPITIDDASVEVALVDVQGVEDGPDLLEEEWTAERIVSRLQSYDFRKLHPVLLEQIQLEASIVPAGVIRNLREERVKSNGEVWVIHKNDADPFPSIPHAHNYESGHKLHLGTGELFIRKECVGRIKKNDLLMLRSKIKYRPLPDLLT
jgi:hypothetical protein